MTNYPRLLTFLQRSAPDLLSGLLASADPQGPLTSDQRISLLGILDGPPLRERLREDYEALTRLVGVESVKEKTAWEGLLRRWSRQAPASTGGGDQRGGLFEWQSPSVAGWLKRFPPALQDSALVLFIRDFDRIAGLVSSCEKPLQEGRLPPDLVRPLADTLHASRGLTGQVLDFVPLSGDALIREKAAGLIRSLRRMQGVSAFLKGMEGHLPPGPIVAAPNSHETVRAVSDVGIVPGTICVGFPNLLWSQWVARLELVRTLLREFPEAKLILSVDGHLVPPATEHLAKLLSPPERERVSFSLRSPGREKIRFEGSNPPSSEAMKDWARDGLLEGKDPQTGRRTVWISPALEELSPQLGQILGVGTGAEVAETPFPFFEGGQYITGPNFVLVGIEELKNAGNLSLSRDSLEWNAGTLASWLGKKVILVGDPVYGQALHHIDLYITLLPNGTAVVSDFTAGWRLAREMTPGDRADWKEEYLQSVREMSDRLALRSKTETVLPQFMEAIGDPTSPVRLFIEKWLPSLQTAVDRDARQLEQAGIRVARIPAIPFPSISGGLGYTNVVIGRNDSGPEVMLYPGYGRIFDQTAERAFREAGFSGRMVPVRGLEYTSAVLGGAVRCMSFLTEGKTGEEHPFLLPLPAALGAIGEIRREWTHPFPPGVPSGASLEQVIADPEFGLNAKEREDLRKMIARVTRRPVDGGYLHVHERINGKEAAMARFAIECHRMIKDPYLSRLEFPITENIFYWDGPVTLALLFYGLDDNKFLDPPALHLAMRAHLEHLMLTLNRLGRESPGGGEEGLS